MLSIDRTLLRSNLSRTVTTEWGRPVSSAWLDNYAIRVIIYATRENMVVVSETLAHVEQLRRNLNPAFEEVRRILP